MMKMRGGSSSSNPSFIVDVVEEYPYPYPSHISTPNLVTVKLSGRDTYNAWKTQMSCLLKSHNMLGFINGRFVSPDHVIRKRKVGDKDEWIRSDELVKSWILGSLSKKTTMDVIDRLTSKLPNQDFTAKDAWDELQCIYGPLVVIQQAQEEEIMTREVDLKTEDEISQVVSKEANEALKWSLESKAHYGQKVYDSTVSENWTSVSTAMMIGNLKFTDKITHNGNTMLHVIVASNKNHHELEYTLTTIPEDYPLADLINSDGSTLLHVAAMAGNTKAVDILMEGGNGGRFREMLITEDKESRTPLAVALSNMRTETADCLLKHIKNLTSEEQDIDLFSKKVEDTLFSGGSGDELLVLAVSSKDFHLANRLREHYKELNSDAVLTALAQNFPLELNFWERRKGYSRPGLWDENRGVSETMICMDGCCGFLGLFGHLCGEQAHERGVRDLSSLNKEVTFYIRSCFHSTILMLVWPFIRKRVQTHNAFRDFLSSMCLLMRSSNDSSYQHHFYINPIFEATKQNAFEIVKTILDCFPSAIWSVNGDGHNIIQYAVINRSEKVYNLLQMSEHKNTYLTIKDPNGNNLLHLAAKLAPPNKLNHISGAALQIQHELQWFKEVERFVCPLNITQFNSFQETPQMLFSKEHKELVIKGEEWMKTTAESYTITAALITTMVFAAAITVPGGNKDNGLPIFTNNIAFTIFAISDAISLFTSVTSLLMFLSILTARYAEQDFLFKLPTKLIIGLANLFISTTAMIIAFSATLYIVFGQQNSLILIAIAALTCLPVTSFVTLQFPLVADLINYYLVSCFASSFQINGSLRVQVAISDTTRT